MLKRDYYQSKHDSSLPSRRRREIEKEKRSFKKMIFIFLFLFFGSGLIYFFFLSPFFQIKKIIISGAQKAEGLEKIEQLTNDFLTHKRFYVLSGRNVFILNQKGLLNVISNNFDLEKVDLKIQWPDALKIIIKEQTSAVIWQEGSTYFILNQNGLLKNKVDNIQMFELPKVNSGTTTEMVLGKKYLTNEQINFIKKLFSLFNFYFNDLDIKQFVVTNLESREVKLITSENWYILFNLDLDPKNTLATLKTVLEQKIGERLRLEYIDARVKDRVYYK